MQSLKSQFKRRVFKHGVNCWITIRSYCRLPTMNRPRKILDTKSIYVLIDFSTTNVYYIFMCLINEHFLQKFSLHDQVVENSEIASRRILLIEDLIRKVELLLNVIKNLYYIWLCVEYIIQFSICAIVGAIVDDSDSVLRSTHLLW